MSALETLRKGEGLERHLVRLLTALAKKGELRIPIAILLDVEEGEAITEVLDDTTGEVVIRYSGHGSQHLIIGPTQEEAWQNQRKQSQATRRSSIKTDAELADIEARAATEQTIRELNQNKPRTTATPFPFSEKQEGDFAP